MVFDLHIDGWPGKLRIERQAGIHCADELDFDHPVAANSPVDVLDRPVHQQLAALDDADRRAAIGQLAEDVAGDQNRLAHPPQLFEQRFDFQPGSRIEPAGGFVQDQHRRIVNQRFGQAQPLLHAARQAVDEVVALVGQVQQFQHVADDLLARRARGI